MSNLKDLLTQAAVLDKAIAEARSAEITQAVTKVRELVQAFDLTADQIFPAARTRRSTAGKSVAPKYRNPASGETWTGRGKPPAWIRDKDRDQFAI